MITMTLTEESKRQFKEALAQNKVAVETACEKALQKFVILLEAQVTDRISEMSTDTGQLLQSVYQKSRGLEGEIGSTAAHAPYIEFGTRPHRPPFQPIYEWAWRKRHDFGISDEDVYPFTMAVIDGIAAHGTNPQLHFTETLDDNEKRFNDMIVQAIKEAVE